MPTIAENIIRIITTRPGLSDREIADALRGRNASPRPINQVARWLVREEILIRTRRPDGIIGNYIRADEVEPRRLAPIVIQEQNHGVDAFTEDDIKRTLKDWLEEEGWQVTVAWGRRQGIDIDARQGLKRWVIEVKGPGSLSAMRVNYFIGILGETLQRMSDSRAQYSIALPDMRQYRNLWGRLPSLAKQRTKISLILVSNKGTVTHQKR